MKCYIKAWFCCADAIQAAFNVFEFLKPLEIYKNFTKEMATKVQNKLSDNNL